MVTHLIALSPSKFLFYVLHCFHLRTELPWKYPQQIRITGLFRNSKNLSKNPSKIRQKIHQKSAKKSIKKSIKNPSNNPSKIPSKKLSQKSSHTIYYPEGAHGHPFDSVVTIQVSLSCSPLLSPSN